MTAYLGSEEGVGLEPLGLNYQLHYAVEGAVVQHWSFPAWEQVGDDAFEQRQVHLQEFREIDVLDVKSKRVKLSRGRQRMCHSESTT